jgi:cytoskeletal protein RodZ
MAFSLHREVTVRDESTNGSDAMTKPRISQVLLWVLALMTLALFGFFVALVAGALPVGDPPPPPDTGALPALKTQPAEEPATTAVTKRVRRTTPAPATTATTTGTPAKTTASASLATVVVTASRGDCWISARLGSETGRVLDERILAQGESVTLRGARVWLSIGAAANVDVTVNGQDREIQSGTVAVVLGPA